MVASTPIAPAALPLSRRGAATTASGLCYAVAAGGGDFLGALALAFAAALAQSLILLIRAFRRARFFVILCCCVICG